MLMIKQGVDLSRWNIVTDYKQVKKQDISFAILKAGGSENGMFKDRLFETHYKGCKDAKIDVGAYFYAGRDFITSARGLEAARYFESIIATKQFEMPVYIDIEEPATVYKKGITDAAIAFCEYMESKGYYVGIYGSDVSSFYSRLELSRLKNFDKWVARYGLKPVYVKEYGMWQKSSTGLIEGINGKVDLDESYKDYKKIMKNKHLNGY